MNQRQAEIELKKIEKIARRIVQEKSSQTCGTYTQCWTYALLKAREEYHEINK
jgi:hypothetical protein